MMFCRNCTEAIPDDSAICPYCGKNPRLLDASKDGEAERLEVASSEAVEDEIKPEAATAGCGIDASGHAAPADGLSEEIADMRDSTLESDDDKTAPSTNDAEAVIYAMHEDPEAESQKSQSKGFKAVIARIPKIGWAAVIALVIALVIVAIAFVAVGEVNKNNLKSDLEGTWYATDGTILQVLEVRDDTMTYSLETGYSFLDSTLDTWNWRPTGATTFEVNLVGSSWEKYEVKFSDDKKGFLVTPALTSTDDSEMWVDIS